MLNVRLQRGPRTPGQEARILEARRRVVAGGPRMQPGIRYGLHLFHAPAPNHIVAENNADEEINFKNASQPG